MSEGRATRRRGAALEEAIADAAWFELASGGYSAFTFEAVARRAETSRAVLYRRWPTRSSLASAAIARHVALNPLVTPDLGNVRDELCLVMRKFADRSPPRLLRLIFEMSADMMSENATFQDMRYRENPLGDILTRAVERGEVDEKALTPRIVRLPLSLVMQDIIVSLRPISDEAIGEIVDEVFLPLVSRRDAQEGASVA